MEIRSSLLPLAFVALLVVLLSFAMQGSIERSGELRRYRDHNFRMQMQVREDAQQLAKQSPRWKVRTTAGYASEGYVWREVVLQDINDASHRLTFTESPHTSYYDVLVQAGQGEIVEFRFVDFKIDRSDISDSYEWDDGYQDSMKNMWCFLELRLASPGR